MYLSLKKLYMFYTDTDLVKWSYTYHFLVTHSLTHSLTK